MQVLLRDAPDEARPLVEFGSGASLKTRLLLDAAPQIGPTNCAAIATCGGCRRRLPAVSHAAGAGAAAMSPGGLRLAGAA